MTNLVGSEDALLQVLERVELEDGDAEQVVVGVGDVDDAGLLVDPDAVRVGEVARSEAANLFLRLLVDGDDAVAFVVAREDHASCD